MANPSIEGFWWFVREREQIRLRKNSGLGAYKNPKTWTEDPTLQIYHFCNIRRADDYGTRWYLQHIPRLATSNKAAFPDLLWRTMLYRLVNNTEWFQRVGVFTYEEWRTSRGRKYWRERILRAPKPYSPAYIILQAPGNTTGRARQLIKVLDLLVKEFDDLVSCVQLAFSLEEVWKILQRPYGMGPFIALQVIRDLLLVKALPFEENDFTYIGPGAQEGLQLLGVPKHYAQMYDSCVALTNDQPRWPFAPLVLGDVEHCLCEYAKYIKFSQGRGRRRKYKPHVQNLS